MTTFEIPRSDEPRVSIIVLGYGTSVWLQRCLQSVVANTPPVYEVIVVDNGSPDDTRSVLERHVRGATVLFNERNVGFGPANNQAALLARAPALCFLNADALVQDGWLPPLLADLEDDPRVGAVAPMLLNWDDAAWDKGFRGALQEAGSIVGHDGTTQSVGYGDDPAQPWYRFPRIVDYASGACLVVRRTAFEAVGGFDPAYAPAYYEDVDLCFSLDAQGWRTLYEPRSSVIHVRGAAGSDAARSALLASHQEVLVERWRDRLAHRPSLTAFPAFAHRSVAARDVLCRGRMLVTAPSIGAEVVDHLSRLLGPDLQDARRLRVTAMGSAGEEPHVGRLRAAGVEVIAGAFDWVDLLERRWFQYDGWLDLGGDGELRRQVLRTQPQAGLVADDLAGIGLVA